MATQLTPAQVQLYTNQALAHGYAQADIDAFYADNSTNDAERLLSALAPNPGPSVAPASVYHPADLAAYAIPTPLSTTIPLSAVPSDAILTARGNLGSNANSSYHASPTLIGSDGTGNAATMIGGDGVPKEFWWALAVAIIIAVFHIGQSK